MNILKQAFQIIKERRRAYLLLNLGYYGMVLVGMVYAAFDRQLQQTMLEAVGIGFSEGIFASIGSAYGGGKTLEAIGLTFVVNLFIGSFATITLPSLIIPFSGLLLGVYRAILWGILFSPTALTLGAAEVATALMLVLLLLLEGQAYVLTLLGVFIHGKGVLKPASLDAATRRQGYWQGIKQTARIYPLVVLVLAVAAVYEVLIAIVILPLIN